jgi:hypothetical protein
MALSRETLIYLALWRKAYRQPETLVEVKCSTNQMAISMRQGIYRAVKPFRGDYSKDPDLAGAAERYVIGMLPSNDETRFAYLRFIPRKSLNELEAQLLDLGLEESELISPDDMAMASSASKVFTELSDPDRAPTPFYTRED